MSKSIHRLALFMTFVVPLASAGCTHLLREKVTPYPADAPHAAPWRLNREFLLPETREIVFVVDRTAGVDPLSAPLDHLVELASEYGERPARWVRAGDPGAPHVEIEAPGRLRCTDEALDPSVSYVFVRYVGDAPWFGRTTTLTAGPECGGRTFHAIHVAQDKLAKHALFWMNRRHLEETDLVHEYGHVLGLGSNPSHGFYPYYPDLFSGDHCVNPQCALAGPHPRAIAYAVWKTGFTFRYNRDFCAQCRMDILQAKQHWRTGKEFPPAPRLPAVNLDTWIANLEAKDFKEGGEAFALLSYSKEVMPALMERMGRLPGSGEDSPRSNAEWIAKAIVMKEAVKRAGEDYAGSYQMGDYTRVMLWWWKQEGRRFMAGEDWELPPVVSVEKKPAGGKPGASETPLPESKGSVEPRPTND